MNQAPVMTIQGGIVMLPRHQPNFGRHPPDRLTSCCRRLAGSVYRLSKTITKTVCGPLPNFGGILYPPGMWFSLCSKSSDSKPDACALPKPQGSRKEMSKAFTFKTSRQPIAMTSRNFKEQSRASFEGCVPDKQILSDNLKALGSKLTDLDTVLELAEFVNDHLLRQPGVIKLVQKRMNLPLIGLALVSQN